MKDDESKFEEKDDFDELNESECRFGKVYTGHSDSIYVDGHIGLGTLLGTTNLIANCEKITSKYIILAELKQTYREEKEIYEEKGLGSSIYKKRRF